MKKLFGSFLISIFIFSCGSSSENEKIDQENKCNCLAEYEIRYVTTEEVEPAVTCLENQDIVLSLENEKTQNLISELDAICPKEARKLWKLCKNIDEGIIIKP